MFLPRRLIAIAENLLIRGVAAGIGSHRLGGPASCYNRLGERGRMRTVIGVMGGADVETTTLRHAYELGRLVADRGWVLLNGGRSAGVMDESARGAAEAGGLVIGILPDCDTTRMSPHVDIPIVTGLNDARNYVNVLSSRVVIALRGGAGTLSEISLALKSRRPVIALDFPLGGAFRSYEQEGLLLSADDAETAIAIAARLIGEKA